MGEARTANDDWTLFSLSRRRLFALGAAGGLAVIAAACSDATSTPSVSSAGGPPQPNSASPAPADTTAGGAGSVAFPLSVDPSHRHLIDATGRPFFMVGDSAWSLIAQLPREKVIQYLDDRAARSFNTLVVDLLAHLFATNAPANFYGDQPFTTAGDYAAPNDAYFAHAKWVIEQAAQRGFLVVLTSSYMGAGGGTQGWYVEMKANGPDKLHDYGRFIGTYFRDSKNILWVHGGDYNPPELELVDAVATGVRETDPGVLETAQNAPWTSTLDLFPDSPWTDLNTLYTYGDVHQLALAEYGRGDRPTFLMESTYENEYKASKSLIRAQAYGALLGGTTGQVFGNNPLWHFDGPGIFDVSKTWEQGLDEQGSHSMTHFASLVRSLPWWTLQPSTGDRVLSTEDLSMGAFAAAAPADGLAVAYLPTTSACDISLAWLGERAAGMSWFDPAGGKSVTVEGSPFRSDVPVQVKPPGPNGDGSSDWILVIRAA